MLVRQLVGRYAGQLVEMDYAQATSCIGCGTAALPDAGVRIRGMAPIKAADPKPDAKKPEEKPAAPEADASVPAAPAREVEVTSISDKPGVRRLKNLETGEVREIIEKAKEAPPNGRRRWRK